MTEKDRKPSESTSFRMNLQRTGNVRLNSGERDTSSTSTRSGITVNSSTCNTTITSTKRKQKYGKPTNTTIKFKTNFRNTIYDTMIRRGWKETNDIDWDIYWADRDYVYELLDTVHLENGQKVNHYRNGREVYICS